jgi:hypothetical protein
MKTVFTTTLLIGAFIAAAPAMAEQNPWSGKFANSYSNSYQQHDKYANKHRPGFRNKALHRNIIRLDIPVRVRGNDRIHLRKLVNRHSNVNLDNYRLKKVVVDNHSRRYATAKLHVGQHQSEVLALHRGSNHIAAPRRSDGRWMLGVRDARIDHIRVVLEPKPYAFKHYGFNRYWQYQHNPWFSDNRRWH